jgi:hypothetical protein
VDDDFPGMLTTLEGRMSRDAIASALGVEERELDEIASGYAPDEDVGNRLRSLVASGVSGRVARISAKAILIFVIVDAVFFAALAVFLIAR